ncbi:DNA repair protein [Flavobacterium collinsii]|uniref:JAB domain-containing protein n=1 Tax=Flavobacterium collinsii TaxID=1114861 RepID=UPI0022BECF5E|nr:JAB domain-containing protein [Flavobacterium collinsii]GIQ57154.1 DNA repair protein [Flavobacterium collinsii]
MKTVKEEKNWKIPSEIELIYKTKIKASQRPHIRSSASAYKIAMEIWNLNTIDFFEQFKILLLNQSNKVLGVYEVASGGISGASIDLRLVFAAALKANASALIMIHNHPSGKTLPSLADKLITQKARHAGSLLDIAVIDHLIITSERYYSFADKGNL